MFNYAQSAATALRLITKFGTSLPIKRLTSTNDAPETLEPSEQTETEGTILAVVLPSKASSMTIPNGEADNKFREAAIKGKLRFILAAAKGATFVPDVDDEITVTNEGIFQIIGCTPLNPAGTPIVYKIGALKK